MGADKVGGDERTIPSASKAGHAQQRVEPTIRVEAAKGTPGDKVDSERTREGNAGPAGVRKGDDVTMARPPVERGSSSRFQKVLPEIAGYEILGELGRGGMGIVYLARQVMLKRPCALKMILAGAHADKPTMARFLAEAEAVAKPRHPNVVQIYTIGRTRGLPYFELEYVEGGSLDHALDGTPWPAKRAARMVEPPARAIAEAHRSGLVHRDLKPANILLAEDGTPKITDFGLAKSLGSDSGLTATESIMGTLSYMAPEQAEVSRRRATRRKARGCGTRVREPRFYHRSRAGTRESRSSAPTAASSPTSRIAG